MICFLRSRFRQASVSPMHFEGPFVWNASCGFVGYSALMETNEARTLERMKVHREELPRRVTTGLIK